MAQQIAIRSKWDRVRYTIVFEVLLICMMAPTVAYVLDRKATDVGALAVVLSLKAMLVSFVYNYLYDRIDVSYGRVPTERKMLARACHAIGFELILTATSLPIIVWWLQTGWLTALAMDLVLVAFVVVFTFIYTWCYDRFFSVTQPVLIAN